MSKKQVQVTNYGETPAIKRLFFWTICEGMTEHRRTYHES